MAIYHLSVTKGSRLKGQSAKAKSDYIQRRGKYASGTDDEVLHVASGHMPAWAEADSGVYWDAADLHERKNGVLFREVEFALPVELSLDEQRRLAGSFAEYLTEAERLPYTLAIHAGNGENPHCHLMISERMNDDVPRPVERWFKRHNGKDIENWGAKKSRSVRTKTWLLSVREAWATFANQALEWAGFDERIDHRTLDDQGVDRLPGVHLGPNVVEMEQRGASTARADEALAITTVNEQITELQIHQEVIDHESNRQSEKSQGNRRAGGADRTLSPGDGSTGGGSEQPARGDAASRPAPSRGLERGAEGHRRAVAASGQPGRGSRSASTRGVEQLDVEAMDRGIDRFDDAYAGATDRVMDLAGSDGVDKPKDGGNLAKTDRRPVRRANRTEQAITRQLQAMDCERYDVGIRDANTGKMMNRTWTAQDIGRNTPWLKRMNAQGNDIYIRPAAGHTAEVAPSRARGLKRSAQEEKHGLVLVDDLSFDDLETMNNAGHDPALVVETSPDNYQAWVKVGEFADAAHRGEIARELAAKYEADKNSADSRHYGRLAGFTNRKDEYTSPTGHQPWVLCRSSSGQVAAEGPQLMLAAGARLKQKQERSQARPVKRSTRRHDPNHTLRAYRQLLERFLNALERRGEQPDISKCDFAVAMKLAEAGHEPEAIAGAMKVASPDITQRKAGHVDDYCARTAQNAQKAVAQSRDEGQGRGETAPRRKTSQSPGPGQG